MISATRHLLLHSYSRSNGFPLSLPSLRPLLGIVTEHNCSLSSADLNAQGRHRFSKSPVNVRVGDKFDFDGLSVIPGEY